VGKYEDSIFLGTGTGFCERLDAAVFGDCRMIARYFRYTGEAALYNSDDEQRSRLSPQLFAYIFACESSPLPALRILAVARLEEKWKVRPYLD